MNHNNRNAIQNIFSKDVSIPPIVQDKIASALASVQRDAAQSSQEEMNMKEKTKKRIFRSWTSAAAFAAAVMLGAGAVFAAVNHFWSDGLKEVFDTSETQMAILEDQGNAIVFDETDAVTVNGVTIQPMEMIADKSSAVLTFLVSGVDESISSGEDLLFDVVAAQTENDSIVSMSGSFYKEKTTDKNGTEGFEYVMQMNGSLLASEEGILGTQVHVGFQNLALSGGKAETGDLLVQGTWNFDITLPSEDSSITCEMDYPLENSNYTVEKMVISPLSMQIYYRVDGEVVITRENTDVPIVFGVVMKDGTQMDRNSTLESGYPALAINLGYPLYNEEGTPNKAQTSLQFNRPIDPAEIDKVILQPWGEAYAWETLPDEIVAEEYGGEVPFERIDPDNIEYWEVPVVQ